MKKKIMLLALALILVCVGAFWGAKAIFFPSTTAQAVARDFLIQTYSIPDHNFYTQEMSSASGTKAALQHKYQTFLTPEYLQVFLTNRTTSMFEAWANEKGYLVAIDQLNIRPASSGNQGSTTYLEYDVTLTLTQESDKRLATYKQSGRVNVEKTKDGYRVSAWDVNNEKAFYSTDFFTQQ